jgi:hypothetical protein
VISEGKSEKFKSFFAHTMKKYKGVELKGTYSNFRHSMDKSNQLQLSAELRWAKELPVSTE